METLLELFDKHKCDKGSSRHRYDRLYEQKFEGIRNKPIRMLEIGVYKGSSTMAWLEYFNKIEIVCVDIFTRVAMEDIKALKNLQVYGYKCNSLKGPGKDFKKYAKDGFDIIIDDGLHTHEAQYKTFKNFIPYLKKEGTYFIEDVLAFNKMSEKQKLNPWLKQHKNDYSEEIYKKLLNVIEPYEVKYHNLREGCNLDTFIIEVRK